MACHRCGSSAPAIRGRCGACGQLVASDADAPTGAISPHRERPVDGEAPTGHGAVADPDAPTGAGGVGASASEAPTGTAGLRALTSELPTETGRIGAVAPDAPTGTARGVAPPRAGGPLTVGHDFGARYHIIRLLGVGGMGAVYQAWDKVLEVAVAVKVIRPPDSDDRRGRAGARAPLQARAAPRAPGHAQARRPHPRSRRNRRHHVHHDAVRPGRRTSRPCSRRKAGCRSIARSRSRGRWRRASRPRTRRASCIAT